MEIRSVTCFVECDWPLDERLLSRVGALGDTARRAFARCGLPVQTIRLATQPLGQLFHGCAPQAVVPLAQSLEAACQGQGVDYCSLGPASVPPAGGGPASPTDVIPDLVRATQHVFVSAEIARPEAGIQLRAIQAAAGAIKRIAAETDQGFGNLRFAALANCPSGSPFFPVAYHGGGPPAFAVATQAADLAVEAFSNGRDWRAGRTRLIQAIESCARRIVAVAEDLSVRHGFRFGGIDFSLAPFPRVEASIGEAIERLTGGRFGEQGTLFAVATLTECLRAADFPRCGFSGVMLPVLEDAVLAQRSLECAYTLDSLLLYSAVCGTGLDTIPLPGDVSEGQLAAVLLDVATLAMSLHKPLTSRLMPIPGRVAGDTTEFDFAYFAPGRVFDLPGVAKPWLLSAGADVHPFSGQE